MKLAHPRYPQPEYDDKVLIVLGADTVVDAEDALAMLKQLQGRDHQVITGMAISVGGSEDPVAIFEETTVSFAEMTDDVLKAYIETGEPFDKAGGYGIQAVGCLLVNAIQGNYQNVVGLPLAPLSKLIQAEMEKSNKIRNGASAETKTQGTMLETLEGSIEQLRQEVAMRDQEISMLVGSLSKRGNNAKEAAQAGHQAQRPPPAERMASGQDSAALLLDRNKAFDAFRKSVRRSETLDEGREVMKHLVAEAKEVGERANAARASVQTIQRRIEKEHLGRVMGSVPHDPATKENAVAALSREKEEKISTYKNSMERLKVVKAEIDKYKLAAEENKERLQRDFEAWYLSLQAHQADLGPDPVASNPSTEAEEAQRSQRPGSAQNHPVVLEPSPRSNSAKESRNVLRGSPAATSPVAPSRAAEALTGHQETDDEIRAYFAAVADLESR
eukprot:symbB.v1.2.028332.t1/scaffold2995.1/size65713/7